MTLERRSESNSQLIDNKETAPPIEIRRFTDEAREALVGEGYMLHELTGQSVSSLREAGLRFSTSWHRGRRKLEALTSMHSEIAIDPDRLFIPGSNNKTLLQQLEIISNFSKKLGKKVPGVEAVMGGMPDYADLTFTHENQMGVKLFGRNFHYIYARSITPQGVVLQVGSYMPDTAASYGGLEISRDVRGGKDRNIFAVPLVRPKG